MDQLILEKAGLTKNEVKTYLALLELGQATAIQISKKAELHTSRAYESLNRLLDKGLVSAVERRGVKHFQAAEPQVILNYMEQRKDDVEKLLPELELLQQKQTETPTATVYYGFKGVTNWFTNLLRSVEKGDEILVFGASGREYASDTAQTFFKNYTRQRIKKGIKQKLLFNVGSKEAGGYYEKQKHTTVRYLPQGAATPAAINIVGNKVATLVWRGAPTLFVIDSKEVADSYRAYFKVLWGASK